MGIWGISVLVKRVVGKWDTYNFDTTAVSVVIAVSKNRVLKIKKSENEPGDIG